MTTDDKVCGVLALALAGAGAGIHWLKGPVAVVPLCMALAVFFLICAVRHWRQWGK